MIKYVLDACALLAFVYKEPGADIVKSVLDRTDDGNAEVYMNKLNLFEVYYNIMRDEGLNHATVFYNMISKLPIIVINGFSDEVFYEAACLKAKYKMSLADSIALGEASVMGATILTSDHHEFDEVESNEEITFLWIR